MDSRIPFSTARLDGLLDASGIDVLIVTSSSTDYQAFGDDARSWNRIPA